MIVNEVTNMIKIVHISDIHIGASFKSASFAGEFALKRQKEIKETFFKVLKYCDDNHIDVLLISGDMFDTEFMKKSDIDNVYNGLKSIKSKSSRIITYFIHIIYYSIIKNYIRR